MTTYRIKSGMCHGQLVYYVSRILNNNEEPIELIISPTLIGAKEIVRAWLKIEANLGKSIDINDVKDIEKVHEIFKE